MDPLNIFMHVACIIDKLQANNYINCSSPYRFALFPRQLQSRKITSIEVITFSTRYHLEKNLYITQDGFRPVHFYVCVIALRHIQFSPGRVLRTRAVLI